MKATLDSNEHAHDGRLQGRLEHNLPCPVVVGGLDAGDLRIELDNGSVLLFERKRVPDDLVKSIGDGRLFDQASRMVECAEYSTLILEGVLRYDHQGRLHMLGPEGYGASVWYRTRVEMALNRVTLQGVAILRDIEDYPEAVGQVVKECAEGKIPHRSPLTFNPNSDEKQRKLDWLVGSLPGIGGARAQELMRIVGEDRPLVDYLSAALDDSTMPRLWGPRSKAKLKEFFGV